MKGILPAFAHRLTVLESTLNSAPTSAAVRSFTSSTGLILVYERKSSTPFGTARLRVTRSTGPSGVTDVMMNGPVT
jgi:hypothetical protein